MRTHTTHILSLMTAAVLLLFAMAIPGAFAESTITLEQPVHFTNAEGSDVVLQAGEYAVEPAEEWLRITPSEGQTVDALLLEAQAATHEESLTEPLAVSAQGEAPDVHHLALLLPGGKRLETIGSYSGVRSRATISALTIQRLQALARARQNNTSSSPEYISPTYGGSGGNRSYNLDCGPGAVMVGFLGKNGLWLDSIGAICQRVNPDGQLGAEFTTRTVGGTGGEVRFRRCPPNRVAARGGAQSGSFINGIGLSCVRWDAANKRGINSDTDERITLNTSLEGAMSIWNSFNSGFICPVPKVLKAFRGKYGMYIDSIRFVCDDWDK